jgi:flagellar hook-basal body complex protein FliE
MQGIASVAEDLLASEEALCSMELSGQIRDKYVRHITSTSV